MVWQITSKSGSIFLVLFLQIQLPIYLEFYQVVIGYPNDSNYKMKWEALASNFTWFYFLAWQN